MGTVITWILLGATFTFLGVSSAVAFFAPDLAWIKPGDFPLPTAFLYGLVALMFLWQSRKDLKALKNK